MARYLLLFLKGIAMGTANVIPGVSGGTIAFVTGIYEEFIDSLKSFDVKALKLAGRLEIRALSKHLNLPFLIPLFLGLGIGLVSLGKMLDWLFVNHSTWVWSFFFGLILASVYYVSKSIEKWSFPAIATFGMGVAVAVALAFLKPSAENGSFGYVVICGIVAICSMILPGLSGSFVLILMGNYQLVMLRGLPSFDLSIIVPFAIGAAIGFVALSHLISYLLRNFGNVTLGALTGFILGSLVIIWPWKSEIYLKDDAGLLLLKKGEPIVQGYDWSLPDLTAPATWMAIVLMVVGIVVVSLLEKTAARA